MRKIKYTIIACLALVFSCQDAVDIQQVGNITPDVAFTTVQDLNDGLNGIYNNYDYTQEIAMGAYTDEVAVGIASGGQGFNDALAFQLNPASDASVAFWANGYFALNRVNVLIEAAQFVEPEAGEEAQYNNILGQAYALRAYAHFTLLSYLTTDYADDNALGVPILDFVPSIDIQALRNTNGEVYDVIESDLALANNLLSEQSNTTFVSRDFVKALRARMAAYRQDYTTAANLAQELLNAYPLANRTDYQLMFLDASDAEVIFKLQRTVGDAYDGQGSTGSVFAGGWAGANFAFTNATIGGGAYYEISRGLFNLLNIQDVRYDVNVAPTSIVSPDYQNADDFVTEDVLVIQKYPGSEGQPLMNDLKIFRSSEMLLILAEARAAEGNFNGSSNSTASLIKQLRDARFGSDQDLPTYSSQAEAFAAILDERRVEFAFEGHRYKDLKRLGQRANQGVERDPLDCAFNGQCTLPATDFRFTLPIPLIEFNGNPGLRDQQNPGY